MAIAVSTEKNRFFEPVNYLIQLPGKRMRPALCLMSANLFTDELDSIGIQAQNLSYFTHFDRFIGHTLYAALHGI